MGERDIGNPDAVQDEQLINECIQREVEPVVRHLLERLQGLEEQLQQVAKATDGIIGGFSEALTGHRKSSLKESLNFGDDFDYDGINSVYKDWEGGDLKDDLIDYIADNDIPDEQLEEIIANLKENARAKYGKYKKIEEPVVEEMTPESGEKPEGVGVAIKVGSPEEIKEEASEEMSEKKEPEENQKPGDKLYENLMREYRANRGNKL